MNGIRQNVFAKTRGRFFLRRQAEFDVGPQTAATMHKIQFAKGVAGPKEFWRLNSLPGEKHRVGCFARIRLYEENARIMFLAFLLVVYLCFGAVCFHFIERENEVAERSQYKEKLEEFLAVHCRRNNESDDRPRTKQRHRAYQKRSRAKLPAINCSQFIELLDLRGNFSLAGLSSDRPKWDFPGSFYFVGTVISTIGFGMTTPRTMFGKVFTMIYGFLGCASCILFFNLFLERIVTLFAHCLRYIRRKKDAFIARRAQQARAKSATNDSDAVARDFSDSELSSITGDDSPPWRPSVYAVFAMLFALCFVHMCIAATAYAHVENWSYFEAIYFCFVGFATIGFGDYVTSQQTNENQLIILYRFGNFLFLSFGCCCVYSLFNVTSIFIRQMLNWIIKTLDVPYRKCCKKKRRKKYMGLGLNPPPAPESPSDSDENVENNLTTSTGLVSLKEFLEQNQASMLMLLQRQLIESARKNTNSSADRKESTGISANAVGPMGILREKFGNDD